MVSDQRPDAQLGTGSPRSELDAEPAIETNPAQRIPGHAARAWVDGQDVTLGVRSGRALPEDIDANRSGSGGSGGPTGPGADPSEEGAADMSMDELLGGMRPTEKHAGG